MDYRHRAAAALRATVIAIAALALAPSTASAQDDHTHTESGGTDHAIGRLATLFQDLYGPTGLTVNSDAVLPDGSTHSAHFNSAFQSNFTQFNIALAAQLTALPLPSPASGFTYTFDTATGTFQRTTQSFGPILADRFETIGRGQMSFGFNYQYFSFDSISGVPLTDVPAVFTHDDADLGGGRADVVDTSNDVRASVKQTSAVLTYGFTDYLDVSVAVPMIETDLSVISNATIERIGTGEATDIHFFRDADAPDGIGDFRQFVASGSATGIGDVLVRAKGSVWKRESGGLAIGADLRFPTGDEMDLLGSGAYGFRPFLAYSTHLARISPHVNASYQWNGESRLGTDPKSGEKGDLPDQWSFIAGADIGVSDRLTLAGDVLFQRVLDSPRLVRLAFDSPTIPAPPLDDIAFETASFNQVNGAFGMKLNVYRRLLVNFNLLFKLNDEGLRDRITPLVGIELGM
jgi:Putative MetA-pathway of phenol degradation